MTFELDPRLAADTVPVTELGICSVRLMDDARWPWLILVPRVAGARDLADLAHADQHAVLDDIDAASRVVRQVFAPFKLNVATLGNVVAQLHIHVIGRAPGDPAWPAPVWGVGVAVRHLASRRDELLTRIRAAFVAGAPLAVGSRSND